MKKLLKLIGIIFLIAFLIVVLYWVWKIAASHYAAILFYGYISIAVITFSIVLFFSSKLTKLSLENMDVSKAVLIPGIASINANKAKSIRFRMGIIFETIAYGLVFPSFITHTLSKSRVARTNGNRGQELTVMSSNIIEGPQLKNTFVSLTLLLLAALFNLYGEVHFSILWSIVSVSTVTFAMLAIICHGQSLPKLFKLQFGNPYLKFLIYGVATALIIFIGFLLIKSSIHKTSIDLPMMLITAKELFSPIHIFNQFTGEDKLTYLAIYSTVIAALFYITIASSIMRWKDFLRTPEDKSSISKNLIIVGRYTEALEWLNGLTNLSPNLHMTKGMSLLSINRIDEGLQEVEKGIQEKQTKELDKYSAALLVGLSFLLPTRVNMKILDRWLNSEPDHAILLLVLQAAPLYFSQEELSELILDSRIKSRPVHHALLLMALGRHTEMEEILASSLPGSEFEEIIRLVFLLPMGISDETSLEEDHLHVHGWLDTQLGLVEEHAEGLNEFQLIGIWVVLLMALNIIRSVKVNREQEVLYLINKLKSQIPNSENNDILSTIFAELEKQR